MRNSMPAPQSSSRLKTLEPAMAKASIAVNRPAITDAIACTDDAVSLVFEALAEIGMSDKEAAYTMGLDPATVSRIRTRQQRLPIDAIWRLPDRFWFSFRQRVDEQRGLTVTSERRIRHARIRELVSLLVDEAAS